MKFQVFCTIILYKFVNINGENSTGNDIDNDIPINYIAEGLLSIFGINEDGNENDRIKELRDKLHKIESYAIDKDRYIELLINETKDTDLNQTNFFDALNENDHFQRSTNDSTSLYLKLKKKMNRDDVLAILAERGEGKMMKSARRMMDDTLVPSRRRHQDKHIEDIVDKVIAEKPYDDHKYDENDEYNKYWDPEQELQELTAYHQHSGRRLYRGERTTIRYYPFMVSVHVMGRFWCGGVLVWHDLVATTAACLQLMHNNRFFRENPKILAVRVGSNHSRIGGEVVDALEVYFHPAYSPRTLRNNIAVIRLHRRVKCSYHRVPKLIPLATSTGGMPDTAEVLLLGWGVTKTSQKLAYEPIFLQQKILPIYPNAFCKEVYGDKFVSHSMFCAGTLTTGEGACDHDAGGPAVMSGRLVGLISFGPSVCGYPNVPTAFTLVGAHAQWIQSVNDSMPSYHRGWQHTTTAPHRTTPTLPSRRPVTTHITPPPQPPAARTPRARVQG